MCVSVLSHSPFFQFSQHPASRTGIITRVLLWGPTPQQGETAYERPQLISSRLEAGLQSMGPSRMWNQTADLLPWLFWPTSSPLPDLCIVAWVSADTWVHADYSCPWAPVLRGSKAGHREFCMAAVTESTNLVAKNTTDVLTYSSAGQKS